MNRSDRQKVDPIENERPPVEIGASLAVDWTESEWFATWLKLMREDRRRREVQGEG